MNELSTIVESQRHQFISVSSVKGIEFDREAQFALQILENSDYLTGIAMKNKNSLKAAINNVAAIGISLNPASKLAYLVPRKGAVCLDISYMGVMHIAQSTGAITWGQAVIVRKEDVFQLNGIDQPPTHKFNPFDKNRGDIIGCYIVVKTSEGDYLTHSMPIDAVFAIRDRSESYKAGKASPWKSDEEEMIKKTVVKQASKYWPRREQLDSVVHYMNNEGGEGIPFEKEITPLDDVETGNPKLIDDDLSAMSAEEQEQVRKISVNIGELLDEGFEWRALDKYEDNPSMEFRGAIWTCLGDRKHEVNGKQILCRTTLKKLKEASDKGERPETGDE